MRKTILFVIGSVLLLAGMGLSACSSNNTEMPDKKDFLIERIIPSDEVSDFFEREWSFFESDTPQNFFPDVVQDTCCVVNNGQEFLGLYHGSSEVPYIDFQQYSLVIGKKAFLTKEGEKRPRKNKEQKLYVVAGRYVMDLYCESFIPDVSFYNNMYVRFWGIYPKFDASNVEVNILYAD